MSGTVYGPDFICVGMVKGATGWLYDQLRFHPDFWMPPIKELRYLHKPSPKMENAADRLQRFRARPNATERRRRSDALNLQFLKEAAVLAGQPRNLDKYASLFRYKENLLSGDISPGYSSLRATIIGEIASRFPQTKIILSVRDPVERAWSHICMLAREGNFDLSNVQDATKFRSYFRHSAVRDASFATTVLQSWTEFAPQLPFRTILFDDIEKRASQVRRDVLLFLGADPGKKNRKFPASFNRKAASSKLKLPDEIRAVLVEELADEIRRCAKLFGGAARSWPARYGL